MRRVVMSLVALAVAFGGVALVAQKVTSPAELDAAMKKIGPAQGATGKAIQAMAYADARASVATVKATLMDAENFWVLNKKDDAIAFSKDAIAKITALEQALSAPAPDQQAVLAALKMAGGTCGACHKTYREQNPADMTYQIKAGAI